MSVREQLKKITEKAKNKIAFTTEIKEFATVLLDHWVDNCAEAASMGHESIELYAFRAETYFEKKIKVLHLIENGLLEFLEKETDLKCILEEYIVRKDTRTVQRIIDNVSFYSQFDDNIFVHIFVIRLSWN